MSHEQFQSCIDECIRSMKACNYCYDSCLSEEHSMNMKVCIRLTRECAQICAFTAEALSLNASYALDLCEICAEVCESCATECVRHRNEHCQRCAEACFSCAQACKALIVH
ncbi:four-helix bundle copper-binding protein [Cohnella kolymensis]|uniref:four-helix bundle copper-binding protein n=1 Tax=Cohnella kolymensis TaxID=1590652 RepID=UPI0009E375C5|nr:four-helix bundle copper-binding protein [Cohnella kolymensis]